MQEVLDKIERAAERCQRAGAEVKRLLTGLDEPSRDETLLEALRRAARETNDAFEDIRLKIVPSIEAIPESDHSSQLTGRINSVRAVAYNSVVREVQPALFSFAQEQASSIGLTPSRLRALRTFFKASDLLAGFYLALVEMPDLAENLHSIAAQLRTTYARRSLDVSLPFRRTEREPAMIKILFLGANPASTTRLALDKEVREITQRLRAASHGQQFEIVHEWAVRISDLQAALLRHQPQIVHFSGHGEATGELLVENEAGAAVTIRPEALSNLFKILKKNIRCVVLNACYSEAQAEAIAQHIECVVGMTTAVGDTGAIAFAWSFYQALGFNSSVQEAFDLGCNQVDLAGLPDTDTPKLIARAGVRPEDVYLLGREASAGGDHLAPAQQGGTSFTLNVTGGTHGAIAVGPGAKAEGSVNVSDLGTGRGKPRL